ncbi:MAG TPA: glycosyltransferase, partial [Ferruginibacter sp.]|nr:glycosyltransferase [Ferruginibacter sp.]
MLKLVTIALIIPMKNHLLVLEALQKCTFDVEYGIYGPVKDEQYWNLCEQQIQLMPSHIKVEYKGNLPPGGVEAALKQSDVFIMPSQSENFAHALAEALSAGLPVITSKHT